MAVRPSSVSKLFIIWYSVMPVSVSTSKVPDLQYIIKLAEEFSSSSTIFEMGKISIFLASSGSFSVKNDNIHRFFFRRFGCKL